MTDFDKVVIPLLDSNILPSDIDEQFVGCFTEDLDHPTDMPVIYMLFKCDKVTQNSINRINHIEKCKNLHTTRYKMIDNVNCVAYGFILTGKYKSLITGNCNLDLKDCLKIASFWGYNDNIVNVINHMPCILMVNKEMPLEDFQYTIDDIFTGKTKEGEGLQFSSPSPFIFLKVLVDNSMNFRQSHYGLKLPPASNEPPPKSWFGSNYPLPNELSVLL